MRKRRWYREKKVMTCQGRLHWLGYRNIEMSDFNTHMLTKHGWRGP